MSTARKGSLPQAFGSLPPGLPEAPISGREEVARRINEALARFDLILSLLETLNKPLIPSPGDSDLRNGCERAMTSILSALAGIEPAAPSSAPPGREEQLAKARLNGEKPYRLIDADRLTRLWSFVDRLLP